MRALDVNGQAEGWPANAEISVNFPATCQPDEFEEDDDPPHARELVLGEWTQANLCGAGDADWYQFFLDQPMDLLIGAASRSGGAAVRITILAEDGSTVLSSSESAGIALGAAVRFRPSAAGSYYVKIEPLTPDLIGTQAVYGIVVAEAKVTYMPVVRR